MLPIVDGPRLGPCLDEPGARQRPGSGITRLDGPLEKSPARLVTAQRPADQLLTAVAIGTSGIWFAAVVKPSSAMLVAKMAMLMPGAPVVSSVRRPLVRLRMRQVDAPQ